jgi:hypothetical protein
VIVSDQRKWEEDKQKVEAFSSNHGIGPNKDRFLSRDLALEFGRLLEKMYDGYYKLEEGKEDKLGFYPNPVGDIN